MKTRIALLITAAFSASAFAQSVDTPTMHQPTHATSVVNPFTGANLSLEDRQREVEHAKLESSLLEEQVKQARLKADLETVPAKKAAELAQVKAQMESAEAAAQARIAEQRAKIAAATPKPVEMPKPVQTVAPKPATPPPPPVTLASILSVNGERAVVLTRGQDSIVVADGEMSPLGRVTVLDDESAQVGNQRMRVHSATLSRMTVSDRSTTDMAGLETSRAASPRGPGNPVILPPVLPPAR